MPRLPGLTAIPPPSSVTSAMVVDNTLVAADIATGGVATDEILDGTIVNADISASAAIGITKIDIAGGTQATMLNPFDDSFVVYVTSAGANRRVTVGDSLVGGASAYVIEDDFISASTAKDFLSGNSGAGSGVTSTTGDGSHPGVSTLSTGTTTTGRANKSSSFGSLQFGGGRHFILGIIQIPTLSDGTETFTIWAGYADLASGESTDAVEIRYTDADGGADATISCVTRSNNVETATDSLITAVAGQWIVYSIAVNAAASSVVFKLGTLISNLATVATNTTNIPSGAGREVGIHAGAILKSAGTTARTLLVDYVYGYGEMTTVR